MIRGRGGITVTSIKKESRKKSWGRSPQSWLFGLRSLAWLGLSLLVCGYPTRAQQSPTDTPPQSGLPSPGEQPPDPQISGRISGSLVDPTGVAAPGATVRLTRADQSLDQETLSGDDGQFSFANVAPGSFRLTITSEGFATQAFDGNLRSGESYAVPRIVLTIATAVTEIRVVPSQFEIAEEQIKEQEKQRPLGI